jgi:hypothetical protein
MEGALEATGPRFPPEATEASPWGSLFLQSRLEAFIGASRFAGAWREITTLAPLVRMLARHIGWPQQMG